MTDDNRNRELDLMRQAASISRVIAAFYLASDETVKNQGVALALTQKWMELNLRKPDVDPQVLDRAVRKLFGFGDAKKP